MKEAQRSHGRTDGPLPLPGLEAESCDSLCIADAGAPLLCERRAARYTCGSGKLLPLPGPRSLPIIHGIKLAHNDGRGAGGSGWCGCRTIRRSWWLVRITLATRPDGLRGDARDAGADHRDLPLRGPTRFVWREWQHRRAPNQPARSDQHSAGSGYGDNRPDRRDPADANRSASAHAGDAAN